MKNKIKNRGKEGKKKKLCIFFIFFEESYTLFLNKRYLQNFINLYVKRIRDFGGF